MLERSKRLKDNAGVPQTGNVAFQPPLASPSPVTAKASPPEGGGRRTPSSAGAVNGGGARIGRPPQWTPSRSRKLARLYVYTTLSIEKIIRVLEDDVFKPRKNSAQKTIHNMLDNDPRYLRPESQLEMDRRINSVLVSAARHRPRQVGPTPPYAETSDQVKNGVVASSVYELRHEESSSSIKSEGCNGVSHAADTSLPGSAVFSPDQPWQSSYSYSNFRNDSITVQTAPSVLDGEEHKEDRRRPRRSSNAASISSELSTTSVKELKRRVSGCSTRYARQLTTILKHLTISSASDLTNGRRYSFAPTDARRPSEVDFYASSSGAGYALPGDFLRLAGLRCHGSPGLDHIGGRCWCAIAETVGNDKSAWLGPSGEITARAQQALVDTTPATLLSRDCFGNTTLHMAAALPNHQQATMTMVRSSRQLGATNTAGQTFLHVLNADWFALDLEAGSSHLKQLFSYVAEHWPGLIHVSDDYGQTVLHKVAEQDALAQIFPSIDPARVSLRDAFGVELPANFIMDGEHSPIAPRRKSDASPPREDSPSSSRGRLTPGTPIDHDTFLAYHARLIQIVHSSYDNPRIEDEEGRNGLHCLAEAIINSQSMNDQRQAFSTGRGLKRKYDRKDTETPEDRTEGPLALRLRHLEGLLKSQPPIDVNHYDRQGSTVLMAFITLIPDDQDDKVRTLCTILEKLLRAGARLEARNRRGETALLLAARLGRKIALSTLLEHGANVNVRDSKGRGVLEIIDTTCSAAIDDLALYARLEACRVLLTGRRDWGVKAAPTVMDEWRTRHRLEKDSISFV